MDALLFASYGTTHDEARARGIDAVARELARSFPGLRVTQAFTSPKVRRVLDARGDHVPDVAGALGELANAGVTRVVVQPGHLVEGRSLSLVGQGVERVRERFDAVSVGEPLLASDDDLLRVAQALDERFPDKAGQALVLMGHGTDTVSNAAYAGVGKALAQIGRDDALVAAFGAGEGIDGILRDLEFLRARDGVRAVDLAPLMLTAGAHTSAEMAGPGPGSWKSRLEAAGYGVTCHMTGLGEVAGVRGLYVEHARAAARAAGIDV